MKSRPSKESLAEIPEIDLSRAKVVRRGPKGAVRLTLRSIREGTGKTQVDIATALETDQGEVSRLERRSDMLLSTLRKYAAALGATCEVALVFPKTGHRIVIADPE
jgi:hypothetical protein